jgi:ketosteroid isomerase-like protein
MCSIRGIAAAHLPIGAGAYHPGCSQKAPAKGADVKALLDTSRAWSSTVATGDVDKIVSYWTDDGVVMMPGEPLRRGKAQIRAYVAASLKTPGFSISWEPLEGVISPSGDTGYLIERDHLTFPDGHGGITKWDGRGVTIWKKQPDGSWKDAIDISQPSEQPGKQS